MLTDINLSASLDGLAFVSPPLVEYQLYMYSPFVYTGVHKKMWRQNTSATTRNSRCAFTNQEPVEEAVTAVFVQDIGEMFKDLRVYLPECNKIT